ncbi:MAG: HAD family hydrolase [Methanomassiliicoccaceae archaeon]|nr:HAD family hydrolase [Methanomassiliicoccaceae archaeon]
MALDKRYKAVAFDMDGTFMKTKIDYVKLSNVVYDSLIDMGIPRSAIESTNRVREQIECGQRWLIENGRAEDARFISKRIADRSTKVEMEYVELSRPFDGAVDVVKELRKKGYKTGIITRGGREYAECILGLNNVIDLFDAIVARDDYPDEEAKPSPMAMVNFGKLVGAVPKEILFLGDSKMDWLTARDSGAGFFGVITGNLGIDEWRSIDPNIQVIESVAALLEMIE